MSCTVKLMQDAGRLMQDAGRLMQDAGRPTTIRNFVIDRWFKIMVSCFGEEA